MTLTASDKKRVYDQLLVLTRGEDMAFELDGPIMCTVRRADGQYRNYSVGAGEFYFLGTRFNEAGEALLAFEPEDADPRFEIVEVKDSHIDKFFPLFFEAVGLFCEKAYGEKTSANGREALAAMLDFEMTVRARQAAAIEQEMLKIPTFGMF